jgi:hypothetical protein
MGRQIEANREKEWFYVRPVEHLGCYISLVRIDGILTRYYKTHNTSDTSALEMLALRTTDRCANALELTRDPVRRSKRFSSAETMPCSSSGLVAMAEPGCRSQRSC